MEIQKLKEVPEQAGIRTQECRTVTPCQAGRPEGQKHAPSIEGTHHGPAEIPLPEIHPEPGVQPAAWNSWSPTNSSKTIRSFMTRRNPRCILVYEPDFRGILEQSSG